jgi:uncharacterized protein (TIGR00369 family)
LVEQGENSPFYQLLGMKIEEAANNYARLSIDIDRRHRQFLNVVHGGVVASLADSAAAWAVYSFGDLKGTPVTVEMKMNFLRPVESGRLVAEARNVHTGSGIFVSDVDIKDGEDNLVAKGLVTYYLIHDSGTPQ